MPAANDPQLICNVPSGCSSFSAALANPATTPITTSVATIFLMFVIVYLLGFVCRNIGFSFATSIGRKSYMPIDKIHLSSRATVEKKKVMKPRNRKLFHGVIAVTLLTLLSSGSSALAQQEQAQSQVMTTTT